MDDCSESFFLWSYILYCWKMITMIICFHAFSSLLHDHFFFLKFILKNSHSTFLCIMNTILEQVTVTTYVCSPFDSDVLKCLSSIAINDKVVNLTLSCHQMSSLSYAEKLFLQSKLIFLNKLTACCHRLL